MKRRPLMLSLGGGEGGSYGYLEKKGEEVKVALVVQ